MISKTNSQVSTLASDVKNDIAVMQAMFNSIVSENGLDGEKGCADFAKAADDCQKKVEQILRLTSK